MYPLLLFHALLTLPAAAAPVAEPTLKHAQEIMGRAFEAFEKAAPVDRVSKDDLDTLEVVPVASREQAALYKRLPLLLQRVRGLQAVRPPQTPVCERIPEPAKDPNGCVVEAVRWLAGGFDIRDTGKIGDITALYLLRYNGPKDQSPAERARSEERVRQAFAEARVLPEVRTRMQAVMRQSGALGTTVGPGPDEGPAITAAEGTLTPRQAALLYRDSGRQAGRQSLPMTTVPSLSEGQRAAAREADEIIRAGTAAGLDRTVWDGVGLGTVYAKRTFHQVAAWATSGETWQRSGEALKWAVTKPGESLSAFNLAGATYEATQHIVHSVFVEGGNRIGETSARFVADPTYFNLMAGVGSLAMTAGDFATGGTRGVVMKEVLKESAETGVRGAVVVDAAAVVREGLKSAAVDQRWQEFAASGKSGAGELDTFLAAQNISADSEMAKRLRSRLPTEQAVGDVSQHVRKLKDELIDSGEFRSIPMASDIEAYAARRGQAKDGPLAQALMKEFGYSNLEASLSRLAAERPKVVAAPVSAGTRELGSAHAAVISRLQEMGYAKNDAAAIIGRLDQGSARELAGIVASGDAGALRRRLSEHMDLGPKPSRTLADVGRQIEMTGSPRSGFTPPREYGPPVSVEQPVYRGMSYQEFQKWVASRGFPADEAASGTMPMKFVSYDLSGAQKYGKHHARPGEPAVIVEFRGAQVVKKTGGAETEREYILLQAQEFRVASMVGVDSSRIYGVTPR